MCISWMVAISVSSPEGQKQMSMKPQRRRMAGNDPNRSTIMSSTTRPGFTCAVALLSCSLLLNEASAQSRPKNVQSEEANPYMGAPVTLGKALNGAIANKKILDGIEKSPGSRRA